MMACSRPARLSHSYSYRIEARGRAFVYTGDTGPLEAVTRLAKGADMLISEVVDVAAMRKVAGNANVDPAAFMQH